MSRINMKWQWKKRNVDGTITDCDCIYDKDYEKCYEPSEFCYGSEEAACAYLESLLDLNVNAYEFSSYVLIRVIASVGNY